MYLVREHLPGSYVLEGDVYLTNNFLLDKIERACYFSGHKFDFNNEWMLSFDKHDKVTNIKIGSGNGYIMSGISYWDMENGTKVKDKLELAVAERGFEDLFWDDIVRDNLSDYDIYVHKIESDDWFEIDSLTDLTKAEFWIKNEIIWSQENIEPNPYR